MDNFKWLDWRIKALNEDRIDDAVEQFTCPKCGKDLERDTSGKHQCSCGWKEKEEEWESKAIAESFYHLTSEAKIGFMLREMKKNLSFIEKKFMMENELSEVDDKKVDNWVKAYSSLKMLDERIHTLLKSMRGK